MYSKVKVKSKKKTKTNVKRYILGNWLICLALLSWLLLMSLPTPFTFSAINCNSLNMASSLQNIQVGKLYGIVKLRTDVIFLSDVRIKCKNLVSNSENILPGWGLECYA